MEAFVEKYFKRFDRSLRLQHLILFVTFIGLGITGIPQLFAEVSICESCINLMGGGENVRMIHHICGVGLIAVSLYHVFELIIRAITGKGSTAILPRPHDAKTVAQNFKYYLGKRKEHPEFGRYSYMEKMEYLSLVWGIPCMAVTGLMIWFPLTTIKILPGQAIPVATAIHAWEAILAGLYVLVVHMYFAHVRPETFPYDPMMFDGRISEHHLAEEHPREYEKLTGEAPRHDLHEHAIVSTDKISTAAVPSPPPVDKAMPASKLPGISATPDNNKTSPNHKENNTSIKPQDKSKGNKDKDKNKDEKTNAKPKSKDDKSSSNIDAANSARLKALE